MTGMAILLLGAAVAYGVARWWDLPAIPLLLVVGIVLGQMHFLPGEILVESLVLGLTFLLFVTGLELDPRRVRNQVGAALRVGILQFVTLGALGTLLSLAFGFDLLTALYLGLALTASSTLVIVRLLQRRRQLFEPFGRLVVGVLLLQDVLVILLIPLLTRAPDGIGPVLVNFAGTVGLVVLTYVTLRWVSPQLVRMQREDELLLLSALAILFGFIGLAHLLELPLAAGAFLAGVALSPFPVRGVLRAQLGSVGDFFTAIFFISLGGLLAPLSAVEMLKALGLAVMLVVVTTVLVTAVAERAGFSARPGIESGLLLSQTSELSLAVALQGLLLAQLTSAVFTMVVLITVATMMATPFLTAERVVQLLLRFHPTRRAAERIEPLEGHVLLLGCGSGGMPLLETLLASGESVMVIDDDPEVIERLRAGDVPCFRGDASDLTILRRAGADRARIISSTVRRPRDNQRLLENFPGVPIVVRVFDQEDAEWVRQLGGTPIVYSEAATDEFMRWYDRREAALAAAPPAERQP